MRKIDTYIMIKYIFEPGPQLFLSPDIELTDNETEYLFHKGLFITIFFLGIFITKLLNQYGHTGLKLF